MRSRPILLKISALLVSLVFTLLLLELASFVVLGVRYHGFKSAHNRFQGDNANTFLSWLSDKKDCGYVDTLYPHPYVGFVHHGNPPCGIANINNIGLFGRDYPSERHDGKFVILLTGGSVAGQFASMRGNEPSYLEEILNRDYISPKGGTFEVLDGGDGAWKQPQQAILFMLYADAVDAVATLDGFNEHYMVGAGSRFELPANNFLDVNPIATSDFKTVALNWIWAKFHRYAQNSAILSRSNLAYLFLKETGPDARGEVASGATRRTTVQTIFALPRDWDEHKREEWSLKQYKKYMLVMESVAHESGVLSAYFVQPVPAIAKPLSDQEKAVVGDLSYAKTYQRMSDDLLDLRRQGLQVFSLVDMFQNSPETLYSDSIHMAAGTGQESRGYRMMAEKMALLLAQSWHLKERPGAAAHR